MSTAKKLEVCFSNLDLGSQDVRERVATEFPEIRLRRWGCLGWCHRCVHCPAVLMDDTEYLEADNADDLYQLVRNYILEHQEPS